MFWRCVAINGLKAAFPKLSHDPKGVTDLFLLPFSTFNCTFPQLVTGAFTYLNGFIYFITVIGHPLCLSVGFTNIKLMRSIKYNL